MLKEYEITVDKDVYCIDVRLGISCIANIWPPRKNKREYWQVRLLFNQEIGKIDYSRDKHINGRQDGRKGKQAGSTHKQKQNTSKEGKRGKRMLFGQRERADGRGGFPPAGGGGEVWVLGHPYRCER